MDEPLTERPAGAEHFRALPALPEKPTSLAALDDFVVRARLQLGAGGG